MKIKIMARECKSSCNEEIKLNETDNDNKELTDEDAEKIVKFAMNDDTLRHRIFDTILKNI